MKSSALLSTLFCFLASSSIMACATEGESIDEQEDKADLGTTLSYDIQADQIFEADSQLRDSQRFELESSVSVAGGVAYVSSDAVVVYPELFETLPGRFFTISMKGRELASDDEFGVRIEGLDNGQWHNLGSSDELHLDFVIKADDFGGFSVDGYVVSTEHIFGETYQVNEEQWVDKSIPYMDAYRFTVAPVRVLSDEGEGSYTAVFEAVY